MHSRRGHCLSHHKSNEEEEGRYRTLTPSVGSSALAHFTHAPSIQGEQEDGKGGRRDAARLLACRRGWDGKARSGSRDLEPLLEGRQKAQMVPAAHAVGTEAPRDDSCKLEV
ncbi:hypothetical protein HPB50_023332 [Hyalomma asiaticum]|uniref:Uncharacterized protein n=1 Tax=Hyalomma asiaticum TaxID=266040 RepID=A0ACB7TMR1_HYAAI|nr:hypothetical protein HPB50_023332 [Hyalomma asiaticum]